MDKKPWFEPTPSQDAKSLTQLKYQSGSVRKKIE